MRQILLMLICAVVLQGCTLVHILVPVDPPPLNGVKPAIQSGHFISPVQPALTQHLRILGFLTYVKWEGLESFRSLSLCFGGLPEQNKPKVKCLQFYGGVKVDGSESYALQRAGDDLWDYVYGPDEEQWAARWHGVGWPNVYDMGGS